LLEVRTVVLGVAVGDPGRPPPPEASPPGGAVLATETDGGRVVVELGEADAEALADGDDHRGQQRGPVGVE
jgi:hypothetical protein